LFFQLGEIVCQSLPIIGEICRAVIWGTFGFFSIPAELPARHGPDAIGLPALLVCEAIGFASQGVEATGLLLALGAAKQVGRFTKALNSAASINLAWLRLGAAHRVVCLAKLIESLLDSWI